MEENKLIIFLSKHWSKLLLGVLAVACMGVWTERFFKVNRSQSKEDFLLASQIFERFQKGDILAVESIEATEHILERHPELHPKYDSMLALTFLAQANIPKGIKYAKSTIDHVQSQLLPLYKDYAATSLLIAEQHYESAFIEAERLSHSLQGQKDFQVLDAMNTLRLFFLADQLGDTAKKSLYWAQLQQHPRYETIQPQFQEGCLSLADYLPH